MHRLTHAPGQLVQPIVFPRVNDARDHIFPAADLPVVLGGGGQHLPAVESHQERADRRGADVEGQAQRPQGLGGDIDQPRRPVGPAPIIRLKQ